MRMKARTLFLIALVIGTIANPNNGSITAQGSVCGLGLVEIGACYSSRSSDGRSLQVASYAFASADEAIVWASNQNLEFHNAWTEFHTDYVFSDHQWAFASLSTNNAGNNVTLMMFVYGNVVNSWITAGDRDDPIGVMSRIWAAMPVNIPSGETLSDQAMSMIPSEDILGTEGFTAGSFFYSESFASESRDSREEEASLTGETGPSTDEVPTAASTSQWSEPAPERDDTLAIMNNPEKYENTLVDIRGSVYQFGTTDGKLVIAVTDGESYAFTVVFEGKVPGLAVGDTVAVHGIMLDRYLYGYPLVDASRVEIIDG